MGSQPINATWTQFDTNLKTCLQDFLVDESLVDVTLVAQDKNFVKAHKLLLAASSTYFRDVFSRCCTTSETVVVLPAVSQADLNSLMQYWYTGQLSAKPQQIHSLREIANTLHIRGLNRLLDSHSDGSNRSAGENYGERSASSSPHPLFLPVQTSINEGSSPSSPQQPRKRRRKLMQPVPKVPSGLTVIPLNDPPTRDVSHDSDSDDSLAEVKMEQLGNSGENVTSTSSRDDSHRQHNFPDHHDSEYADPYYSGNSQLEPTSEDNSLSYYEQGMAEGDDDDNKDLILNAPNEEDTGGGSDEGMVYPSTSGSMQDFSQIRERLQHDAGRKDVKLEDNQCPRCLHVFCDTRGYNKHIMSSQYTGCKPRYQCTLCSCSFVQVGSYRRHLITRHQVPQDSPLMMRRTKSDYKAPTTAEYKHLNASFNALLALKAFANRDNSAQ